MAYKHGVYVRENATSLTATIAGTAGLQVVVGTAPVNLAKDPAAAVNKPVLVNSFAEAVEAMGYSDDFAAYTLCQSMDAAFRVVGCAPLVLINVLDPAKHSVNLTEQTVQVNNKVAVLETEGVLLDGLTVKNGSSAMKAGTDYTAAFDDAGHVMITLIGSATASTLTVTGKKLDPSKVTAADIVGSVTASTGAVTGLEAVQQVYPMLGMTPGVLLVPGYSKDATVAAAMQAKCTALNVPLCVRMRCGQRQEWCQGVHGREREERGHRPERCQLLCGLALRQGWRKGVQRQRHCGCRDGLPGCR